MTDHGVILTICHNLHPEMAHHSDDGHVWLQINDGRKSTSYGLWPAWDRVSDDRLRRVLIPQGHNRSGTHVQKNVEAHNKLRKRHRVHWSRSWRLDRVMAERLEQLIDRSSQYSSRTNNCVDWACGIVSALAGVKLVVKQEPAPKYVAPDQVIGVRTDKIISAPRMMERNMLRLDFVDNATLVSQPLQAQNGLRMLALSHRSAESSLQNKLPFLLAPASKDVLIGHKSASLVS